MWPGDGFANRLVTGAATSSPFNRRKRLGQKILEVTLEMGAEQQHGRTIEGDDLEPTSWVRATDCGVCSHNLVGID